MRSVATITQPKEETKIQRAADPDSARGPLSGIKVLDLSGYIAGPNGCALLGDLGAEVIKIEPPGGDTFRKYPSTLPSEARAFLGVNRNTLRKKIRDLDIQVVRSAR